MSKNHVTQSDIRVSNVKQFTNDVYGGKSREFYKDFKLNLKKIKYTDESIENKLKQLRNALGKYKGKSFTETLENIVEKSFNLPGGILSRVREKRHLAYIFLSCTGKSANIIFSEVKKIEIVDEVVILFGDVDILIKVYATSFELQRFIMEEIYAINGVSITRTKTYNSLDEKCWIKYPVNNHPDYIPPCDRWCK